MSEEKTRYIYRNVAIALGIVCFILVVGLVAAFATYTSMINSRDNTIVIKDNQMQTKLNQINDLQNQIDALEAPKLVKVHLMAEDHRPLFATPYLRVYGYICNVGSNWAYNCKLHVVAYQSGGVVAIDTYISLGTIGGESWTSVDSNVFYSGSALVSWTIMQEWTS